MTLTTFWQETYSFSAFQFVIAFVWGWLISPTLGAYLLLGGICIAGLATGALICDGLNRLFRKLIGYRVRILIERVR